MTDERTIKELIDSLNNSIEDIRQHPTKIDRIPSNFEIIVRGISDSKAIDMLFSTRVDTLISSLFKMIEVGDFEKILSSEESLKALSDTIFGKGSFQGPVSKAILNNIQASVESEKYQTMKSNIHKAFVSLKKKNLVLKNLRKGAGAFERNSDEYKKYNEAVNAIKAVIKFTEKIYRSRKIINKKVFNGLNNIVHESLEYDEMVG